MDARLVNPCRDSRLPLRAVGVGLVIGGRTLLDSLSFDIRTGGTTVVLGPNGAGKSLLLKLCHGLLKPTSGKLCWADGTPSAPSRRQALVCQRPVLFRRSVAANVDYVLRLLGTPRIARPRRVAELLASTGLSAYARHPARVLSGGEQQRLALARAWALQPDIMFLDEPTANLDPAATRAIEVLIGAIRALGTTVVLSTHDLAQAQRLADRVLFLHRGRLVEQGPTDAFFCTPKTREAAAFIGGELLWQ